MMIRARSLHWRYVIRVEPIARATAMIHRKRGFFTAAVTKTPASIAQANNGKYRLAPSRAISTNQTGMVAVDTRNHAHHNRRFRRIAQTAAEMSHAINSFRPESNQVEYSNWFR